MSRNFYDISIELSNNTAVYNGDPNVEIEDVFNISKGDDFNLSKLIITTHSGTHIDAPKHFFTDGYGIEEIPIEKLIGKAKVFEILNCSKIEKHHLENLFIEDGDRVFFKTSNYDKVTHKIFYEEFVHLTLEAAEYLVDKNINTVGIDYFSIESFNDDEFRVHKLLLKNSIVIVEGLNLKDVPEGNYELCALPIKIKNSDGAPARVVLYK